MSQHGRGRDGVLASAPTVLDCECLLGVRSASASDGRSLDVTVDDARGEESGVLCRHATAFGWSEVHLLDDERPVVRSESGIELSVSRGPGDAGRVVCGEAGRHERIRVDTLGRSRSDAIRNVGAAMSQRCHTPVNSRTIAGRTLP